MGGDELEFGSDSIVPGKHQFEEVVEDIGAIMATNGLDWFDEERAVPMTKTQRKRANRKTAKAQEGGRTVVVL